MSAETIAALILQFGVPFAEKLWTMFTTASGPTAADWAALTALANQNATTKMQAALVANGIDPNSPQGKSLLALVQ